MENSRDDEAAAAAQQTGIDNEGAAAAASRQKLIPEWSVGADDQIVLAGLGVLAAFLLLLGWNQWRGDDGDASIDDATAIVNDAASDAGLVAAPAVVGGDVTPTTAAPTTTEAPATTAAPTTEAPTTTEAAVDLSPDVASAVADFGSVTGTATGSVALLEGFVGTDADRNDAGERAAAVEGITEVDNQLVVLDADVLAAISGAGASNPSVEMNDTIATVRGEVADEAARDAALAAAAAVPGVTSVVDELTIAPDVTAELNALFELEPIQFATGSADILPASFTTLDQAVEILADNTKPLEVQGYTDVRGSDAANLALSQARADSVTAYLVDKGVAADTLDPVGYGETTQFGEGDTDEALAANRRVRFELI